jgi:UDP-N-acetylglucosamine 1-carboxyvinyltransferase
MVNGIDSTMMTNVVKASQKGDDVLRVIGGKPLEGSIRVRGAKNFVSKAMVAALLAPGTSVLRNVPEIRDVQVVSDLLRLHGVGVDVDGDEGVVTIDASHVELADVADVDTLSGSSRIPILFSGPLLNRLGEAFIPALGGCRIGDRPIDFHLETLRKLGANVNKEHEDGIHITAPNGLHGAKIHLPYPSVGATEQTLLAAVLAEGKTELSGAATEPEIMDLVAVLQKMGALISVDVDRTIRIEGVKSLKGYRHTSLTDRIEAASWASAALATHGDIFVKGADQDDMMTFLNVFRRIGGEFDVTDEGIRFWHPGGDLKPVAIETDVHPGFMTDWQQPLVVALTQAKGLSIVHETVYENRFGFTKPLVQMGATIQLYKECLGSLPCRFQQRNFEHSAVIFGPTPLEGREIEVPDLRGGFSHLIAALTAKGESTIHGISLIDRGYADFRGKLSALGAEII